MKQLKYCLIIFNLFFFSTLCRFILGHDSGGVLLPEQAAYDVKFYDLDLRIDPIKRVISGSLIVQIQIIKDIDSLLFDLHQNYIVDSILYKIENEKYLKANFSRTIDRIYIYKPKSISISDNVSIKIFYKGTPPYIQHDYSKASGFWWSKTNTDEPWISVKCELEGADIWWPCKDHPSDEPDSMSLHFTVPQPLTCVSNGQFRGIRQNIDGTTTFNWFVSTPINNYNVTLYICDYKLIEDTYTSINGKTIPFYFWVIPEDYELALNYMGVFKGEFIFLESICGPYPFSMDKHGWAQSPYYGMEHQTIIAYGNNFKVNNWGYDYIHLHELAHEWWGNLVTAKDWSDLWIHEGLATYMEALYVERFRGKRAYHTFMGAGLESIYIENPLAPIYSMTATHSFHNLHSYHRGKWVLHTLRYHLGDDKFFNLLKHWAYIDTSDTDNSNGRLCRLNNTEDMKQIAETVTGVELDPFFKVFFREPEFPTLIVTRFPNETKFKWVTESKVPLDLNIPITVNGIEQQVQMDSGKGKINILQNDKIQIDPDNWILMKQYKIITDIKADVFSNIPTSFELSQNYPNPFNPSTTINYSIDVETFIRLNVFDVLGREVATLVNKKQKPGNYKVSWDASNQPSGVYLYKLTAAGFVETKKMILLR